MATGWAHDGAVQEQIDATVKDAIERARAQLRSGPGLSHCEDCDARIPEANSGYNRRGSKDSQLR